MDYSYMTVVSHENDSHKGSVRGARRFKEKLFNFLGVNLGLGCLVCAVSVCVCGS